jgi:hypothetical protein
MDLKEALAVHPLELTRVGVAPLTEGEWTIEELQEKFGEGSELEILLRAASQGIALLKQGAKYVSFVPKLEQAAEI